MTRSPLAFLLPPAPARRASAVLTAPLAAGILALSACSIVYQGPDEPSSPAETPVSTEASAEASADASAEASADGDAADDPSALPDAVLEQYGPAASVVSCTDGSFSLLQDGAVVRLDGTCEEVSVSADAAVLIAPEVGSLEVTGSGNVVIVGSAGSVTTGGDANAVSWTSGSPTVTDTGVANINQPYEE